MPALNNNVQPSLPVRGLNRSRLKLGSALSCVSAVLLLSTVTPAQAADECGSPVDGSVICVPGQCLS